MEEGREREGEGADISTYRDILVHSSSFCQDTCAAPRLSLFVPVLLV